MKAQLAPLGNLFVLLDLDVDEPSGRLAHFGGATVGGACLGGGPPGGAPDGGATVFVTGRVVRRARMAR